MNALLLVMHKDVSRFVEHMGLQWEEEGLPRIAGRIYGLALVSHDPCSLDEIAKTLKVSKPSVSNDARMLHKLGLIERVSFPGDRKDYYQLTGDSMERALETKLRRLRGFLSVIASAASLPIQSDEVLRRIDAHIFAHRAVLEAMEGVIATLKAQHHQPARSSRT